MRLKNTYEKYNVFKTLQKTTNPDKNLHKISIKTNKKNKEFIRNEHRKEQEIG